MPSVERIIEEVIVCLREVNYIAHGQQDCKRKAVGCAMVSFNSFGSLKRHTLGINGPTVVCTGVKGSCGCAHAEPRAVMAALREFPGERFVLLCTYSPCTSCANVIVDSEAVRAVVFHHFTDHDPRGLEILLASMPVLSTDQLVDGTDKTAAILVEFCDDPTS